MDCIFCSIIAGRLPASLAYEDERVVAFLDRRPVTRGHLLVVPRAHAAGLASLDPADAERMMRVGQSIALALYRCAIPVEGVNLFLSDGAVAGQEVPHAHLHVVPRTPVDGFHVDARFGTPDRATLDADAAAIRDALCKRQAHISPATIVK